MKILYLFALSLSATISLVVVSPAIVQAEGTRSAQAPVPKPDPLPAIIQQEAALLKRTQTSNTAEQMRTLYRQVVADTLEFYSSRSPSPAVPSSETTVYFGDLCHRYPQSGILSILFAESLAAQKDDFGQVAPIYQDAIKAHPNHPLLASRYADYLQRQGTQRGIAVLEQAIRAQPQNFNAYLDLAYFQQGDPGLTIAVFDRSIAAFPKNTQVYTQFAKIALDRHYDKGYLTEIIDRVIVAKKNFPQNSDLDVLLVGLYKQVGQTPMAIDMLKQAEKAAIPEYLIPKYLISYWLSCISKITRLMKHSIIIVRHSKLEAISATTSSAIGHKLSKPRAKLNRPGNCSANLYALMQPIQKQSITVSPVYTS